jgi:hypothetical protein
MPGLLRRLKSKLAQGLRDSLAFKVRRRMERCDPKTKTAVCRPFILEQWTELDHLRPQEGV